MDRVLSTSHRHIVISAVVYSHKSRSDHKSCKIWLRSVKIIRQREPLKKFLLFLVFVLLCLMAFHLNFICPIVSQLTDRPTGRQTDRPRPTEEMPVTFLNNSDYVYFIKIRYIARMHALTHISLWTVLHSYCHFWLFTFVSRLHICHARARTHAI